MRMKCTSDSGPSEGGTVREYDFIPDDGTEPLFPPLTRRTSGTEATRWTVGQTYDISMDEDGK